MPRYGVAIQPALLLGLVFISMPYALKNESVRFDHRDKKPVEWQEVGGDDAFFDTGQPGGVFCLWFGWSS